MAAEKSLYAEGIPEHGPRCSTVPGVVDGWARALADHGTMSLADAFAPAIEFAEAGFPRPPAFHRVAQSEWRDSHGGRRTWFSFHARGERS